ncbi:uncharacterized protein KY384_005583 [Bacidia gigantensis]|uniref:uncharacterized protein n=1 Tax=Bacidia gigantensis TaxID=2732470 RepID=UPI001D043ED8|nr:uncharacterized protein KY384_005583 [Bacidia gigantensis]KAG8530101.1 hypothetical protein KY384_005583 [Bacidia gigantensis]
MSKGINGGDVKRRKLTNGDQRSKSASRIFVPFRTVGLVCSTHVPFTSLPLGKTTFQITTSVGRCLHTYDLRRGLNLVFLTRPQTPAEIAATCAWKDRVFAAWGGQDEEDAGIWVFKRGKKVGELEPVGGTPEAIKKIVVFGQWIVGCGSRRLEVWKADNYEHYTTITPVGTKGDAGSPLTGDVCSMPTYLNKLLVGKRDGTVDVWNIMTALEPSPALSILAIARADGSILLHDIGKDKVVLKLNANSGRNSAIDSISFRTDGLGASGDDSKPGLMATASKGSGDVTFWDLYDGGRVKGILRGAHDLPPSSVDNCGINRVEFLPGQDVIITSGMDNTLKSWIFDAKALSPIPRILHSRGGHAAPVTKLSFVPSNSEGSDASGKWIMSAGRDQSLWGWSLRRDGQSTELSQGKVRSKAKKLGSLSKSLENGVSSTLEDLKAPEITSIACSLNRDGGMGAAAGGGSVWTNTTSKKTPVDTSAISMTGWESIVTSHKGDSTARTWFWGRKKAGRWAFESGDGTEVTTVAITACGTFALIGSAGGSISMFNLQSGILRQKYPAALSPAQARKLKAGLGNGDTNTTNRSTKFPPGLGKHTKAITGIMVDALNRTVISCSLDGKIKFWDFMKGLLQEELNWAPMTSITSLKFHRHNDLIAAACDDLSIRVVDIETKKTIRELWGCFGQISDHCFSNDGRWIIAASMDSVIRTWDLPTGHLINAFQTESPCTSLAFSETGEYLATAHADSVGINIWNNRTIFTHVPTRPIKDDEILPATAPTSSGEGGQALIEAAFDDDEEKEDDENDIDAGPLPVDDLASELLTLSLVPKSRWQTLVNIDLVRARNKPKEPPKAPEKAPFFLPSIDSSKPQKAINEPAGQNLDEQLTPAERSRISKVATTTLSDFTNLLRFSTQDGDYKAFISHLSELSPSAADIAIRTLDLAEMTGFVNALTWRLKQRRDFELVQAWMNVFLKLHGDVIAGGSDEAGEEKPALIAALREWRGVQDEERRRLQRLVGFISGTIEFLRSGR